MNLTFRALASHGCLLCLEDLCREMLSGICEVPLNCEGEDSCCEYFDYLDFTALTFLLTTDLRDHRESWTLDYVDRYSEYTLLVLALKNQLVALIDRHQCMRHSRSMAMAFLVKTLEDRTSRLSLKDKPFKVSFLLETF